MMMMMTMMTTNFLVKYVIGKDFLFSQQKMMFVYGFSFAFSSPERERERERQT